MQWSTPPASIELRFGGARRVQRRLGVKPDEHVQLWVEPLDAGEQCAHQLDRGEAPLGKGLPKLGGAKPVRLGHSVVPGRIGGHGSAPGSVGTAMTAAWVRGLLGGGDHVLGEVAPSLLQTGGTGQGRHELLVHRTCSIRFAGCWHTRIVTGHKKSGRHQVGAALQVCATGAAQIGEETDGDTADVR